MTNESLLTNNIINWLEEYLNSSGLSVFIVGVSGGVDSALVSTLCAKSKKPTHVFNIPIKSTEKNTALSNLQCEWLAKEYNNVIIHEVNLTTTYNEFSKTVGESVSSGLANANTKSRLRMVLLYHFATDFKGLVVGTGNKIEDYGVGFFTKYGDGGVDISPIGNLTKSDVRRCASYLGIPSEILVAPPTDGLWEDNRTDESQLGASYEELEWGMDYVDTNQTYTLNERQKVVIDIFLGFRNRNKHKINQIPVYKPT